MLQTSMPALLNQFLNISRIEDMKWDSDASWNAKLTNVHICTLTVQNPSNFHVKRLYYLVLLTFYSLVFFYFHNPLLKYRLSSARWIYISRFRTNTLSTNALEISLLKNTLIQNKNQVWAEKQKKNNITVLFCHHFWSNHMQPCLKS